MKYLECEIPDKEDRYTWIYWLLECMAGDEIRGADMGKVGLGLYHGLRLFKTFIDIWSLGLTHQANKVLFSRFDGGQNQAHAAIHLDYVLPLVTVPDRPQRETCASQEEFEVRTRRWNNAKSTRRRQTRDARIYAMQAQAIENEREAPYAELMKRCQERHKKMQHQMRAWTPEQRATEYARRDSEVYATEAVEEWARECWNKDRPVEEQHEFLLGEVIQNPARIIPTNANARSRTWKNLHVIGPLADNHYHPNRYYERDQLSMWGVLVQNERALPPGIRWTGVIGATLCDPPWDEWSPAVEVPMVVGLHPSHALTDSQHGRWHERLIEKIEQLVATGKRNAVAGLGGVGVD